MQNNPLYGNKAAQIWFSGRNQPGERIVDDVVLDNIMFATDAQQRTLYLSMNYDDVRFGQSDRNYFCNPYHSMHIFVNRYTGYSGGWVQEDLTLQGWRALSGYDGNSREFSHLDQFSGGVIQHPATSRIVYNVTLSPVNIDLEDDTYCDVDGNKIYAVVTLEPFESNVLISCDFAVPDPSLAGEEHAAR